MPELTIKAAGGVSQLRRTTLVDTIPPHPLAQAAERSPRRVDPVMKGHEDGGNVLYERCEALLPGKLEALSDRSLERR